MTRSAIHPNIPILVVDDNMGCLEAAEFLLENYGFSDVQIAEHPLTALEKFIDHPPRLVLMDVMMPDMRGTKLAEIMRKIDPTVKVIFVSAAEQIKDAACGRGLFFLPKPHTADALFMMIEDVLAQ